MTATLSSTLTCKAWDGSTGGILAMDVSARLTLNGTTSVSGKGFRGGIQRQLVGQTGVAATDYRILGPANATTTTGTGGMKGEGIAGTPRLMPNANNGVGLDGYLNGDWYRGGPGNAGGGGNDSTPTTNDENAGGGGGGNGGAGGIGGASWNGNALIGGYPGAIVTASGGVAVLGGGGGAGSRNNHTGADGDGGGGAGGGIVLIRTLTVSGTGAITANGADAPGVLNPSLSDAAGGGGAGGTVLIYAKTGGLSGLSVTAQGGRGGDAWPAEAPGTWPGQHHGPGGGGGGGSILLSSAPGIASVNGGMNGISCTDSDAYGSAPGNLGTIGTSLAEASLPGADPGYLCATPATYITKASSAGTGYVGPGQTITYTIEVTNTTTTAWTGVAVNDPLPANTSFVAASTQVTKVTYPTGNYADFFANQDYANSTGSLTWSPVWTEQVEADGPLAGNIRVVADPFGGAAYSLRMNNTTTRWIYRALDLSPYSNAALSFRYARLAMTQNDTMTVQVSTDGGGAWTTIRTIKGYYYNSGATSITDPAFLTEYFDLTPYISANFRLRFFPGSTFANTIYFDDINISVATTTVTNPIGGSPPTLVSGQTLLPGESMTVTFQVTVNDPTRPRGHQHRQHRHGDDGRGHQPAGQRVQPHHPAAGGEFPHLRPGHGHIGHLHRSRGQHDHSLPEWGIHRDDYGPGRRHLDARGRVGARRRRHHHRQGHLRRGRLRCIQHRHRDQSALHHQDLQRGHRVCLARADHHLHGNGHEHLGLHLDQCGPHRSPARRHHLGQHAVDLSHQHQRDVLR